MTSTGSAVTAGVIRPHQASTTWRCLCLVFALLVGGVPSARARVVLARTLRIVVMPVVLAVTMVNGMLQRGRLAAHRATADLIRWAIAGIAAAVTGPSTTKPTPQPGPDRPRDRTPDLVPGSGSGPTSCSNKRPGRENANPRSTRQLDREDHFHRHLGTRSATFSGRSS